MKGKKKNTQFIGYTYKPVQEVNSVLLKAILDLENYKIPQSNPLSSLDYLQLERDDEYQLNSVNRFKKNQEKT